MAKPARLFSSLASGLLPLCPGRAAGTFEHLSQASNRTDRLAQGRRPTPSLALVDAQSIKLAPRLGQQQGLDAHKRVNGHKRQVLRDTGRRIWRLARGRARGQWLR